MNINDFKSTFQGGARPSLFRVRQTFPAVVSGDDANRDMEFLCKGAQLPGSSIGVVEVFYMGRPVKVAGDRTFEEVTFTVINDVNFRIRDAYERWMALMNTHEGNTGETNPNAYWGDAVIEQLDRDGNVLKAYKLVSGFPSNISAIELAFDSTDQVEEFTVTMQYQYWQTDQVS